ncbi:MAG: SHOCT domain-containing protein [Desulfosarcina sp.]|nr:SHOCT domain-containing protein [Desulfosarcina sp.]
MQLKHFTVWADNQILKARYARGEITVEEFQRMKMDLL